MLGRTSLGSLCLWLWRIIVTLVLVICSLTLLLLLMVHLGQQSSSATAKDKVIIDGQLQDFIHQEVYGEQALFPIKNKLPRNRFLIISYTTASRLAVEVTRNKKVFSVNVNKKLEEMDSPSLKLSWRRKATSATTLSSLNLIRNVFDCGKENSSKLMTREERERCQETKLRAVIISALPVTDLEPILGQYGPHLKVLLLHSDPRSVLFSRPGQQDNKEEQPLSETANRICSQMVRDQQRLEEFGTGPNMRAVALFSEELFLLQFKKARLRLETFLALPKQDASFQEEDLEGRFLRSYSWLQDKTQKDLAGSSIDLKCKAFYESSVYRAVRGNANGTFVLSNQTFPLFAK